MDITRIAGEETWALLGRMLMLTFFYAGVAWVALRIAGVLLRRVQMAVSRRERPRRGRHNRTVHVIR